MRTPAQIAGHPIHPMLVTVPIGLWVFSLVCDFIARNSQSPEIWSTCALYAMVGGILGALAAALPGLVDLLSLRDREIRTTALTHMALDLTIVALYIVNAWTRMHGSVSPNLSLGLSVVAIGMLLVSGWLGGKLVYVAGGAVHADAVQDSARRDDWQTGRQPAAWGGAGAAPMRRAGDRAMASDQPSSETDRSGR